MLTLIRGKSRKSVYMELLCQSTKDSVYILYGVEYPVLLPEDKIVFDFSRSDTARTEMKSLESELWTVCERAMKSMYNTAFIYTNFETNEEIEVLRNINDKIDGRINLVVSVQDNAIPNGQIIIEEIR